MEFSTFVITNKGQALIAKLMQGTCSCTFTAIKLSSQAYAENQLAGLTALAGVKQTTSISRKTVLNATSIQIEGALDNTGLTAGYSIQTIGIFADDPDEGEILFAVARATTAGYMPPYNGITVSGGYFKFVITVGNAERVTIQLDPAGYATIGDIKALEGEIAGLKGRVESVEGSAGGIETLESEVTGLRERVGGAEENITGLQERVGGAEEDISSLKGIVGYVEEDIFGLEVDLVNRHNTRIAGAKDLLSGQRFDNIQAFGGRYRCNLTDDGVEVAKYGEEAYSETGRLILAVTKDGVTYPAGTPVQVMVKQPRFYYRVVPLETEPIEGGKGHHLRKARYYVSDTPKAGFRLHPAFIHNGIEQPCVYLAAYEGTLFDTSANAYILDDAQVADFAADKLCSIANAKPASGLTQNLTRRNCGKLAENRGPGWFQSYAALISMTQMLILIEHGSFDAQNGIGEGNTTKQDDGTTNMSVNTGGTQAYGNRTMWASANGALYVTYRGEENLWGNLWAFVDGMNIYGYGRNELYVADHGFAENGKDAPYENAGITLARKNGYVSALAYNEAFDWLFLPSETNGNSIFPVGDYFSQSCDSKRFLIARLGGAWGDGYTAGVFFWTVSNAENSHDRRIGGRLAYIPKTTA